MNLLSLWIKTQIDLYRLWRFGPDLPRPLANLQALEACAVRLEAAQHIKELPRDFHIEIALALMPHYEQIGDFNVISPRQGWRYGYKPFEPPPLQITPRTAIKFLGSNYDYRIHGTPGITHVQFYTRSAMDAVYVEARGVLLEATFLAAVLRFVAKDASLSV